MPSSKGVTLNTWNSIPSGSEDEDEDEDEDDDDDIAQHGPAANKKNINMVPAL
jgi:hypothetical protein